MYTRYPRVSNRMMLTIAMLMYNLMEQRNFKSFQELLFHMSKAKDVIFSLKDIKPFFAQFYTLFYFYKLAKENQISILEATTHHIEWNRE